MKPLVVLLVTFGLSLLIIRLLHHQYEVALAARIAMSCMLVFTAIGHFAFSKGMSLMIPDFIPHKLEVVYLTGIIEILAAIGLHIPSLRNLTGILLILFFILILPANIKAAIDQLNFQTGNYDGKGLGYLWFRVPLQILLIIWTYGSAIR